MGPSEWKMMVTNVVCSNLPFYYFFSFRKTFPKVDDFNEFGPNLSMCTEL